MRSLSASVPQRCGPAPGRLPFASASGAERLWDGASFTAVATPPPQPLQSLLRRTPRSGGGVSTRGSDARLLCWIHDPPGMARQRPHQYRSASNLTRQRQPPAARDVYSVSRSATADHANVERPLRPESTTAAPKPGRLLPRSRDRSGMPCRSRGHRGRRLAFLHAVRDRAHRPRRGTAVVLSRALHRVGGTR